MHPERISDSAQTKKVTIDDQAYSRDIENILQLFKLPQLLSPIHDLTSEEMDILSSDALSDGITTNNSKRIPHRFIQF